MKAWYFSAKDRCLRYDDGRLIEPGVTHKVDCAPVLCNSGLHASANIMDALGYAPGPILWRVELGGNIVSGDDKACATERTYLWGVDASECLREFARKCALDVIHLWNAQEIVVQYLKTGDESIRDAARDAAWAAARNAAWAASWAAAGAAARNAAWAAAGAAARNAAWAASWAAAGAAARNAAWAAAGDAARDASWDAAREKQSRRLLAMVRKLPRIGAAP